MVTGDQMSRMFEPILINETKPEHVQSVPTQEALPLRARDCRLRAHPQVLLASLRPNQTFQSICPTFNSDQKYYTSAFINPY